MSIAGIASVVLSPDPAHSSTDTTPAQPSQSAGNTADTVQLTAAERVYVMYIQGQHVSQIATALNLPVSVVDSYLNLSRSAA